MKGSAMKPQNRILTCLLVVTVAVELSQTSLARKNDDTGAAKVEEADKPDKDRPDGEKQKQRAVNGKAVEAVRKRYREVDELNNEIVEMKREVKLLNAGAEDERQQRRNERQIKQLESKIERAGKKLDRAVAKARKPLERDLEKLQEQDAQIEKKITKGRNREKWLQEQAKITGKIRSLTQTLDGLEVLGQAKLEGEEAD